MYNTRIDNLEQISTSAKFILTSQQPHLVTRSITGGEGLLEEDTVFH